MSKMLESKQVLESRDITKNLKYTTYVNCTQDFIILELSYLNNKFLVQKTFKNNIDGVEQMEKFKLLFDKDSDIIKYLKLK